MSALVPITVTPTQIVRGPAFVDYADGTGALVMVDSPVYPRTSRCRELREARADAGVSLGDCARRSGLSVVQVSQLEHGALTLSDDDWTALLALVRGAT